jgi:hypothetical protein
MQDLDGLQPERLDAVEDPLAGAEQDRRDVERERPERLVGLPQRRASQRARSASNERSDSMPT